MLAECCTCSRCSMFPDFGNHAMLYDLAVDCAQSRAWFSEALASCSKLCSQTLRKCQQAGRRTADKEVAPCTDETISVMSAWHSRASLSRGSTEKGSSIWTPARHSQAQFALYQFAGPVPAHMLGSRHTYDPPMFSMPSKKNAMPAVIGMVACRSQCHYQ